MTITIAPTAPGNAPAGHQTGSPRQPNSALQNFYHGGSSAAAGSSPDESQPQPVKSPGPDAAAVESQSDPGPNNGLTLNRTTMLAALTVTLPPTPIQIAQAFPRRQKANVNNLLNRLEQNTHDIIMDHLGYSTGWDPRQWIDTPGAEQPYRQTAMFDPRTYRPGSPDQVQRLLALDAVATYQTVFEANLEKRIALRAELLAAYQKLAKGAHSELEAQIKNVAAACDLTPTTDSEQPVPDPNYRQTMTQRHARMAINAMAQAREKRK